MNVSTLAGVLKVIGTEAIDLESKADTVLRIVKEKKIRDLQAWNAAVRAAYRANGWNGKPGKPKAGSKKGTPPPATVKQYVSAIRRAFRMKLLVPSYSSFYALRAELKAKAQKLRKPRLQVVPGLEGVKVAQPGELTGGPFHDLVVLYDALDKKRRAQMLSAVDRVKRQFATAAPQLTVIAEPEMRKAA